MLLLAGLLATGVTSVTRGAPPTLTKPPTLSPLPPNPISPEVLVQRPELEEWRDFEGLRGSMEPKELRSFFAKRPQLVATRLVQAATTLSQAKADWERSEGLEAGSKSDEFDPTKDVRNEAPDEGTRGARLCEAMASLGPICVKISQTLSQRPDLVGDEAATALKRLQTRNVPFEDELAWAVVKESFNWEGPIAPGVGVDSGADEAAPPLFAAISAAPVATASLGQVYKATTHEGLDVAVKVQRPDAMAVLAKDYMCFVTIWSLVELYWKITPGGFDNGDISSVVDRVASEILDELGTTRTLPQTQDPPALAPRLCLKLPVSRALAWQTTRRRLPTASASRSRSPSSASSPRPSSCRRTLRRRCS